jgi:hypothetical protein
MIFPTSPSNELPTWLVILSAAKNLERVRWEIPANFNEILRFAQDDFGFYNNNLDFLFSNPGFPELAI